VADKEAATMTVGALAKYLALDVRRVQRLEKMGIVVKKGRGNYLLFPSVPNYIAFIRQGGNLEGARVGSDEPISMDNISAKHIQFEEYRAKKAYAETQEIKLKEMKGDLHRVEVVRTWAVGMILATKKRLRAIPAKLATSLSAINDPDRVAELLLSEIDDALKEVSADAGILKPKP
jgi:phage terminase Nu1 subunit (DNA packaging protein)